MSTIQILVVADDPLARAGLSMMLSHEPDCEVVGQVNSTDLVEELSEGPVADVIVWDAGWELPEQIPEWTEVAVPVIALLPPLMPDEVTIHLLWKVGIKVMLSRQVDGAALAAAAHTAVHNLIILDNEIAAGLLPLDNRESEMEASVDTLTPRENEVLHLLAEGLTNKAIAHQLHISEHTIKFHVNAIMGKLNAQSRTDAVVRATRLGILSL